MNIIASSELGLWTKREAEGLLAALNGLHSRDDVMQNTTAGWKWLQILKGQFEVKFTKLQEEVNIKCFGIYLGDGSWVGDSDDD